MLDGNPTRTGSRQLFVICALLPHCSDGPATSGAPNTSYASAPDLGLVSSGPTAGENSNTVEIALTVPDFTAARSEQLDASMMDFLSDYQSINATGWHDGPGRRRGWAYGAYLDGELGSHVRIGTLIDEIDMHGPTAASLDGPWQLGQYPARDALMKLGYWSVRHMSDRIGAELDPARRAMMVEVVMKVLGTKMTRWYLRGIIRDPVTRGELDRSLAALGATEVPPELFEPPSVVGSEHDSYTFRIPDLDSLASTGTYAAVLQLLATHRQLRADLAARLANGKLSDAGRTYLIYILGEMRAAEAVEPLLDVIDFKTHPDGNGMHARWDQRPVEQAL
jgi:hypothetical protein